MADHSSLGNMSKGCGPRRLYAEYAWGLDCDIADIGSSLWELISLLCHCETSSICCCYHIFSKSLLTNVVVGANCDY
jgi:hypothetical protein